MVFRQAFEVVLDAGNGIGQGVEVLPVGHGLAHQQLFLDVAVAGLQQVCGTGQGNHRQTATDLSQQLGDAGQVLMIPLRGNEFDDGVFGLLQAGTRLLDHQLVNLRHIGGGQMAFFTAAFVGRTGHARQGRFDVKQRAGDIHQQRIAGFTLAGSQAMDHIDLVENDFARLAEAQHGEGIADLLERRHQAFQLGHLAAVAAHEQVQAVLDPHQLFTECRHHRTHGITIRTGQAGTLLVDHIGVGQGIVQAVLFFQHANARRLGAGLGDIEQQVLGQIIGRRLVDAIGTLLDQTLEFFIDLAQQGTHRGAMTHAAIGQAFDHTGGDLPQRAEGRLFAQGFQASKNPRHIAQVGGHILIADDPDQGHLQHLPQLAQQHRQLGSAQLGQRIVGQNRQTDGQIGGKQAGFRQQLLAASRTQVIQQRQHHHRQVTPRTLGAIQVHRQLQNRLHQHFQGFALIAHAVFQQRLRQLFHFLSQQRGAVELHHLQSALDLVQIGQTETHACGVLRTLDVCLQGLTRLLQGFRDLALDPLQGDIVVPITHSRLLSLPGECENLIVGHRHEVRMLPTHYFAHAHHQQPSRRQAFGQAVEDFAAAPATKVDQ